MGELFGVGGGGQRVCLPPSQIIAPPCPPPLPTPMNNDNIIDNNELIAGRPKAALLFWFFGDFRCGALLFMVIHVIYKNKNR